MILALAVKNLSKYYGKHKVLSPRDLLVKFTVGNWQDNPSMK